MPIPVPDADGVVHLASPDDLADALNRSLTTDELTRAQRRLDRAQELLADRVVGLVSRVLSWPGGLAPINPSTAADVIASVVARQWRNPEGATSTSRTAGPFMRSVSYRDQEDPGELVVTDGDVEKLLGSASGYTAPGTIYARARDWFDPCSPQA